MIWILSLWIKKNNITHIVGYHEDPIELLKSWLDKSDEYGFLWTYQNPARKLIAKYIDLEKVNETYFKHTIGYYALMKAFNINDQYGLDVNEVHLYIQPLNRISEEARSWTNLSGSLTVP